MKTRPLGIEELAKRAFGTTDDYLIAGYLLKDGSMLNFLSKESPFKVLGNFYSGFDNPMLEFMKAGNIRIQNGYRFSMIATPTATQMRMLKFGYDEAESEHRQFRIDKCDENGNVVDTFFNFEDFVLEEYNFFTAPNCAERRLI